jgi:hypothetical protein
MRIPLLQLVVAALVAADGQEQQPLTSSKGGKSDLIYE